MACAWPAAQCVWELASAQLIWGLCLFRLAGLDICIYWQPKVPKADRADLETDAWTITNLGGAWCAE